MIAQSMLFRVLNEERSLGILKAFGECFVRHGRQNRMSRIKEHDTFDFSPLGGVDNAMRFFKFLADAHDGGRIVIDDAHHAIPGDGVTKTSIE